MVIIISILIKKNLQNDQEIIQNGYNNLFQKK